MNQKNEKPQENRKDTGYSKSSAPGISLPKGGGAMKGIDEKFSVNAVNGTSGMSIPVPGLKTRSDFAPGLTLSYNSGSGNSEFGLGWSLSLPSIQRKTDKRLPKYNDLEESDVFLFAGSEDLVPVIGTEEKPNPRIGEAIIPDFPTSAIVEYKITKYVPRIEGLFASIEKIQSPSESYYYWKVTTKDNVTTFFGLNAISRLKDPEYPDRIFKWLPDISFDDKGNCHVFEYKEEDLEDVTNQVHEQHRHSGTQSFANVYLKKIRYGNNDPFYINTDNPFSVELPLETSFFYTTIFDYGEHNTDVPTLLEDTVWSCRMDPFSDYHAGFEIRTYRLCKRILCFSHLNELTEEEDLEGAYLVQSLDLTYRYEGLSAVLRETDYLIEASHWMYKKNETAYDKRRLPPLSFQYNEVEWDTTIHNVTKENLVNAPIGLSNGYQWVDFFGEGISGILTEQAEGWYYKSNWGDGTFSPAQKIAPKPNFGGLQIQDLDADGKKYAVSNIPGMQGFFELDDDDKWQNFRTFKNMPNVDLNDPHSRMLDLNGDGMPDILITKEQVFTYYESKGTEGYEQSKTSTHPLDENKGPAIVFADSIQSIFLADMSGDGMTDIVRIRNKDVCYWPNLGYGKFGAKVTMSNAPLMDKPDQFNPAYIHLSDISGTGASDIIYLGKNEFRAWLNLSGNGWSDVEKISSFPQSELPNTLSVIDLLGNGTSCLVWSSPLPQYSNAPMRYIDLMGGNKPYLMYKYSNNAGKEVTLTYKSSTHYYLEDKKQGKPWVTKLPFPVHCVQRTEIADLIAGTTYSNLYSYHHGYYDHPEREFRGFGRVETLDTETFVDPNAIGNLNEPPILTKTWYHTGAWIREGKILDHFKDEYFKPQDYNSATFSENDLIQPALSPTWTAIEQREAARAFKGVPLRQEIYANDETDKSHLPYSTTQYNYDIQQLQGKELNRFAVYLVHEKENIGYHYERDAADPRIAHSLNIVIDEYANIVEAASVVYGRKATPGGLPSIVEEKQEKIHIIYTFNEYTNDVESDLAYRLRLPWRSRQFELTGSEPDGEYFTPEELYMDFNLGGVPIPSPTPVPEPTPEIDYSVTAGNITPEKRLIEAQFTCFYDDAASLALGEGELQSKGIPYESYRLAFTEDMLGDIYDTKVDPYAMLEDKGKYILIPYNLDSAEKNYYWIPSGVTTYNEDNYDGTHTAVNAADNFFLPMSYTDPFDNTTHLKYYENYRLLLQYTKDALGNITSILDFEWRILQPTSLLDINENGTVVSYNILGLPVGIALLGKGSDNEAGTEGDTLEGFLPDKDDLFDIIDLFDFPVFSAPGFLVNATMRYVYDFDNYMNYQMPLRVMTIMREEHYVDNETPPLQISIEYTDGLGRVLMKKVNAEPGDFLYVDSYGDVQTGNTGSEIRWVGTGRMIMNNKGKPIKQYEPYFSSIPHYESDIQLVQIGFSPVIYYDSIGRAIHTEMPDGTFSKVEFDAWVQKSYDANDTVNDSQWKIDRSSGGDLYSITEEVDALTKTVNHSADTPTTIYTDSLGRPFYTILHNKIWDSGTSSFVDQMIPNYVLLDIESNTKQVIDGRGNTQFEYAHDMLGNIIYQKSIDSGERWMLNDVFGKPIYGWDSMDQIAHNIYDELHRPTESYIDDGVANRKITEIVYGTNTTVNANGMPIMSRDGGGEKNIISYDFKGNPLESTLELLDSETITDVNWSASPTLSGEVFTTEMTYDALNRPKLLIDPGLNETKNEYNEAGLLTKVSLKPSGGSYFDYVTDIDYNAKGQREAIWYGNGTKTKYEYNPKNYRLKRLLTTLSSTVYQDLNYYFDAVGNITTVRDDNYDTINNEQLMFFNNDVITPTQTFTYDALYRLIVATGREQSASTAFSSSDNYDDNGWMTSHKGNGNNIRNYTQKYTYDGVGNLLELQHIAGAASYTRTYDIDPDSNKLLKTTIGATDYEYGYDVHGNQIEFPHLADVEWNALNQLSKTTKGSNSTFYQYDSSGQRVRKYTDKGSIKEERIYLGSYEIYRKFTGGSVTEEWRTVHILDDTGRIAMRETRTVGTSTTLTRYIYSNHLQSASLELNGSAEIISYEEYHPFGTTSYQAMNASINATAKRYRFTGKERDEESGLYYNGARYYIPWLCRWCAVDPMEGKYAGMSSYNYSFNNPVMLSDPSGADPDKKEDNEIPACVKRPSSSTKQLDLSTGIPHWTQVLPEVIVKGKIDLGNPNKRNPEEGNPKEVVATFTITSILKKATSKLLYDNLLVFDAWFGSLEGKSTSSTNAKYVTDTYLSSAIELNLFVNNGMNFNVDESQADKFVNYEIFVVTQLLNNFLSGTGPENYSFPVNGVISSKFYESDLFKQALSDFNSGQLAEDEPTQYSFGIPELGEDALRNVTFFSITGFVGSSTFTFSKDSEGVGVKIFNITSLSSGAILKNPNDISTFPKSYVRDSDKITSYGNISQTFYLFIPKNSPLLKRK